MTSAREHESAARHTETPPRAARGGALRRNTATFLGLAAVLGLALTGCGQSKPAASPTPTSAATTAAAPTTEGAEPSTAGTAPSSAAPATSAGPALCKAADLAGSVDDTGGGAAGSIYMKLIVKNTSGASCILDGYPGVSLVTQPADQPIGAPAERNTSLPSKGPITLAPGQGAAAQLQYTQAGNYPNCTKVPATSIMVYPPSATDRLFISHPLTACSNTDIVLLHIGAFQP